MVKAFFLYYQRFAFTALLFVLMLSLAGGAVNRHLAAISFFFVSPVFQYLTYHHIFKRERVFYFHLGFSDQSLWLVSVFINSLICAGLLWL